MVCTASGQFLLARTEAPLEAAFVRPASSWFTPALGRAASLPRNATRASHPFTCIGKCVSARHKSVWQHRQGSMVRVDEGGRSWESMRGLWAVICAEMLARQNAHRPSPLPPSTSQAPLPQIASEADISKEPSRVVSGYASACMAVCEAERKGKRTRRAERTAMDPAQYLLQKQQARCLVFCEHGNGNENEKGRRRRGSLLRRERAVKIRAGVKQANVDLGVLLTCCNGSSKASALARRNTRRPSSLPPPTSQAPLPQIASKADISKEPSRVVSGHACACIEDGDEEEEIARAPKRTPAKPSAAADLASSPATDCERDQRQERTQPGGLGVRGRLHWPSARRERKGERERDERRGPLWTQHSTCCQSNRPGFWFSASTGMRMRSLLRAVRGVSTAMVCG